MDEQQHKLAGDIGLWLANLRDMVESTTIDVVNSGSIPDVVTHFASLRDTTKALAAKVTEIQKHVEALSQEIIPTMFLNNGRMSSFRLKGIGTVTVGERWSASMLDKQTALNWLRNSNNGGIIQETVNSQTLGAIAKDAQIAGKPLPSDLFKVSSTAYTSITK